MKTKAEVVAFLHKNGCKELMVSESSDRIYFSRDSYSLTIGVGDDFGWTRWMTNCVDIDNELKRWQNERA